MTLKETKLTKAGILLGKFAIIFLVLAQNVNAEIFFADDFEGGEVSAGPKPIWGWSPGMAESRVSTINTDGMYGENDIYTVSADRPYTGTYSWKLDFEGRNNWCNQCGSKEVVLTDSDINSSCVTLAGGPFASYMFNKDNGFSAWDVLSNENGMVCWDGASVRAESLFSQSQFSTNDRVAFPYQCDVNGVVGGRIGRRSDCNKAINYLEGVSSQHFSFGQSIARRFYLYIPSETVLPNITLKLGYAHFRKDGRRVANTLKLSVQRGLTLEMSAPGGNFTDGFRLERNRWYYFEELFTRESAVNAGDGEYVLWVSASDEQNPQPIRRQSNINIGELLDMSFNGNFQHTNDAKGVIFFDDVVIADQRVGPIFSTLSPAPAAPSGFKVFLQP
jgi:hypothetical protein